MFITIEIANIIKTYARILSEESNMLRTIVTKPAAKKILAYSHILRVFLLRTTNTYISTVNIESNATIIRKGISCTYILATKLSDP